CSERGIVEYSPESGKLYADDVISKVTGKFSKNRYHTQGRFIRLLDSYHRTGEFDFKMMPRGKIQPVNEHHRLLYAQYISFLGKQYGNENTIHFYSYGMYSFLQYLESSGHSDIEKLDPSIVFDYIRQSKQNRQREILCELRSVFHFLCREDLIGSIAGVHAPRIKKIIQTLEDDELERIHAAINNGEVTLRDGAIVLLGLSTGIRACDVIRLKLSDLDWEMETITFRQSKTGNIVHLPLTVKVGNAIARYITEERPAAPNDYLFVRGIAPFNPLADHASCHCIVKRVFQKAGISTNRVLGMHMLRHNAASIMVRNAVPVETIAAVLGHSSPDSTDIYISTDEERLRECVLPMTGISTEVHA
ncbi:MAG: site-specific integrase, partial [Oscillospiraceae bacterium]|nr:site-specific integrase [Oscillospiraceae bacterium]